MSNAQYRMFNIQGRIGIEGDERPTSNIDAVVKSRETPFYVIPAKAGIQYTRVLAILWTPVFTGVTTFYGFINIDEPVKKEFTPRFLRLCSEIFAVADLRPLTF